MLCVANKSTSDIVGTNSWVHLSLKNPELRSIDYYCIMQLHAMDKSEGRWDLRTEIHRSLSNPTAVHHSSLSSVNSRLIDTYMGVNLMHFKILCVFGLFSGERNLGFWGNPPQEIAGIDTAHCAHFYTGVGWRHISLYIIITLHRTGLIVQISQLRLIYTVDRAITIMLYNLILRTRNSSLQRFRDIAHNWQWPARLDDTLSPKIKYAY